MEVECGGKGEGCRVVDDGDGDGDGGGSDGGLILLTGVVGDAVVDVVVGGEDVVKIPSSSSSSSSGNLEKKISSIEFEETLFKGTLYVCVCV